MAIVINFSAAIAAYEKRGQWNHALALFKEMRRTSMTTKMISFNTAIPV